MSAGSSRIGHGLQVTVKRDAPSGRHLLLGIVTSVAANVERGEVMGFDLESSFGILLGVYFPAQDSATETTGGQPDERSSLSDG